MGVRALIRQEPQNPTIPKDIHKNHEPDRLTTRSPEPTEKVKGGDEVWQIMTGKSRRRSNHPDPLPVGDFAAPLKGEVTISPKGKITTPPEGMDKWLAQRVLRKRQDLGALVKWTGPACKWAISLATAIDAVMNVLHPNINTKTTFLWPLNVQAGADEKKQRIFFTAKHRSNRWESDFSEIEAALSLGLFEAKYHTSKHNGSINSENDDWFRSEVEKAQQKKCITLLGPSTSTALGNLKWWLGLQNTKLKELTLYKDKSGKISKIEERRPRKFQGSTSEEDEANLSIMEYPIAGFESSWQNDGENDSEQHDNDSPASSNCLAAVSEVDLELLYALHMFSAFM